jgi:hypothetical protein
MIIFLLVKNQVKIKIEMIKNKKKKIKKLKKKKIKEIKRKNKKTIINN